MCGSSHYRTVKAAYEEALQGNKLFFTCVETVKIFNATLVI